MMTLEYFKNTLKPNNFTREADFLISKDKRIKISLYKEGGFGSFYDDVWWENANYEDEDDIVAEMTADLVEEFGHPAY